ncbi:WD repeat domain 65, partial [Strigomonas culicis]
MMLASALPHGVVSLAVDQLEHVLVAVTISGKLFSTPFQNEWFTADVATTRLTAPVFTPICQSFHSGSIRGMACSVRKPYLMTSSSDHSVRLWNTQTKRLELCKYYKQLPGALALHPSGLMAVVSFPDKVHVKSILWDALQDRKIISFRNTSDVKFSSGGQHFAVSHGNVVDVFDSATLENVGQLRGHPQRVRDFQWCASSPYPTDDRLITCSPDGMIMDWNSSDLRKETEHSDKRYQYTCVTSDDKTVWAVGVPTSAAATEQQFKVTLRELERHNMGVIGGASEDFHFKDTTLTCLQVAAHQRLLFAGGEDGTLKFMTFPLQSSVQEPPLTAHGLAITKVVLSFDETTLFTASADGTIIVWDVLSEDGGRRAAAPAAGTSDEVLVTQHELDDTLTEMDALQQQLERLKTDIEGDEKRKNHEQRTRMREKEEEFKSNAAAREEQYAAMFNTKTTQERSFVAIKLEKEADAARELEVLERHCQADVEELEATCTRLQDTLDTNETQHAKSLEELERRLQQQLEEEEAHFQDVLAQKREALAKLHRQADRSRQANQEALHQLELDTDAEAQEVTTQNTGGLRVLRERYLHMKGEGAIMRKNAARTEKEIEVRAGELQLLDRAKAALSSQLSELSLQLTQLHQDIDGRDSTIGEREKEIYALKRQNQELEKHKFVLDHRIRQLKAQMEPKQREIALQSQKVTQKNKELEELYANNQTLHANIDEIKEDIAQQQQQTKKLMNKIKDVETYMQTARKDISDLAPVVQDPAQLKELLQWLYTKHVAANSGTRVQQADPQVKKEFGAQLGYLASSVEALQRSVKTDQGRHRAEMSAMMEENLALIREIHNLRTTIQQLRNRINAD